MGVLRVGVVGTGFGARVVAPSFAAAGCDVVDVVSARDEAAVAALYRRPVDLICVHSPPFLHTQQVVRAVEAGRAVLCDKPFGRSAAESGAMVDAADQAKVLNFVNFEFRFEPARIHLKQIIDEGAIGTPEHLHWTAWNSAWRTPSRPFGWQFDQTAGGGWIGAWGSHAVDAIRWLLGDVTGAGAHTRIVVSERPDADGAMHRCDAEDGFTAWLELSSGSTATIDASSTAAAPLPPRVVISGSEGVVEITNDRRVVLRRPDGGREESDLGGRSGDPHLLPMLRWAEAIRESITEGHQVSPSFADGLACAQVLDAFRSGPAGASPGR